MEFLHFEALDEDEDIGSDVEGKISDNGNLISFFDDSETNENVWEYYRFNSITRSTESALNDAFNESIRELELENDVTKFCKSSDKELPEVDKFENSTKKVRTFEESLLFPNEVDSDNSLFYSIRYAMHFLKSSKTNKCIDEEIEEVIGSDLYRQLNNEKEYLQLDMDYQKI